LGKKRENASMMEFCLPNISKPINQAQGVGGKSGEDSRPSAAKEPLGKTQRKSVRKPIIKPMNQKRFSVTS